MSKKRSDVGILSGEELKEYKAILHSPGVELATAIGTFASPFGFLRDSIGGFDEVKFILDRAATGDTEALAVRDFELAMIRFQRLGEPHGYSEDLLRKYLLDHETEFDQYCHENFPWRFSFEVANMEARASDPATDELLDLHVIERMHEFGFSKTSRKYTHNYWRCVSSALPRPVVIEFDKGSRHPSKKMSGYLNIPDLGYGLSLADPFFFSGATFFTTIGDRLAVQLERFFDQYLRIAPNIFEVIARSIGDSKGFLESRTRKLIT
ncbi:MAG: hypothetical protein WBX15_14485 [Thermoanaerobaculia bacterium]